MGIWKCCSAQNKYIPFYIQETHFIQSASGGSGLKIREMACDQKAAILNFSDQLGNSGQVKWMCKHSAFSQDSLALCPWAGHSLSLGSSEETQWYKAQQKTVAILGTCQVRLQVQVYEYEAVWCWKRASVLSKTMNSRLKNTHTYSPSPLLDFFVSSFPSCPPSPPHDVSGDSWKAPKVIRPLAITNTCFDRLAPASACKPLTGSYRPGQTYSHVLAPVMHTLTHT